MKYQPLYTVEGQRKLRATIRKQQHILMDAQRHYLRLQTKQLANPYQQYSAEKEKHLRYIKALREHIKMLKEYKTAGKNILF